MNKIQQKLRSRAGASMILAMMFMMFCAFIGGTVLASATANAQRVAQMAEQQDFLLERSAALMASDQLQLQSGKYLRLSIKDEISVIQEAGEVAPGSGTIVPLPDGYKTEVRSISFQVLTNANLTPMHRLMLEATVWRYLDEYDPEETAVSLSFVGFPDGVTATNQFQFQPVIQEHNIEGALNVSSTATGTTVSIPDYIAYFSSGRDQDLFDFFVHFGENSQVRMTMNAYSGTGSPITVPDPPTTGSVPGDPPPSGYIQVTRTSTTTTISWENPLVEKGGAD